MSVSDSMLFDSIDMLRVKATQPQLSWLESKLREKAERAVSEGDTPRAVEFFRRSHMVSALIPDAPLGSAVNFGKLNYLLAKQLARPRAEIFAEARALAKTLLRGNAAAGARGGETQFRQYVDNLD